jgi:hypothetical protein
MTVRIVNNVDTVDDPFGVTVEGEKEQLAEVGRLLQLNCTWLLKPYNGVTTTV